MVRWVSKTQEETKWHDGEKTFTNARMVGGKVDTIPERSSMAKELEKMFLPKQKPSAKKNLISNSRE